MGLGLSATDRVGKSERDRLSLLVLLFSGDLLITENYRKHLEETHQTYLIKLCFEMNSLWEHMLICSIKLMPQFLSTKTCPVSSTCGNNESEKCLIKTWSCTVDPVLWHIFTTANTLLSAFVVKLLLSNCYFGCVAEWQHWIWQLIESREALSRQWWSVVHLWGGTERVEAECEAAP